MTTARLVGASDAGSDSNVSNNYFVLGKYTADGSGKVTEIRVYSLANGNIKVGVYADNGGEPGSRLSCNNTGQACIANQWNVLTIPDFDVVQGTAYWLGFNIDTLGVMSKTLSAGVIRNKAATYSTFTFPDPAGSGFSSSTSKIHIAGWGIKILNTSGVSQPVSYGSPEVLISSALIIQTSSIVQPIISGILTLCYPHTISLPGIAQPITVGGPWVGIFGFIKPAGTAQQISIGSPTILKYVWHVILDGQYAVETPGVNRACIIGRDQYGNPVYGNAVDSTELGLVGERLDFQQEVAIPTDSQAASMASAVLSRMKLTKARGVILIPPNCGQELFDIVQISDSGANQTAIKFRVVGIRFEYNPKQARYEHKLILGAP
jgi:hypothetical protein